MQYNTVLAVVGAPDYLGPYFAQVRDRAPGARIELEPYPLGFARVCLSGPQQRALFAHMGARAADEMSAAVLSKAHRFPNAHCGLNASFDSALALRNPERGRLKK
jgi:hypothetical protein